MILNERKRNIKFLDEINKYKVKCQFCGHTEILLSRPFIICGWCGHKVYRSKKAEFLDKMKKVIK